MSSSGGYTERSNRVMKLSLKQCRRLDPSLARLSDKELKNVRDELYQVGELVVADWFAKQEVSKINGANLHTNNN